MKVAIYGVGGFARELFRIAGQSSEGGKEAVRFVSDSPAEHGHYCESLVGSLAELPPDYALVLSAADWRVRRAMAEKAGGRAFAELIAPTHVRGQGVEVGEGGVFCDFTMITADARIGRHFHCNIYSYVAHDCVIGDFVTFAPRVCCNGNVRIEDDVYVGTGAVLKQGTRDKPLVIGKGAVIGMGAVVTKDVAPGVTVTGCPARPVSR